MAIRQVEGREREYEDDTPWWMQPDVTQPTTPAPTVNPPGFIPGPAPQPRPGYQYVLDPKTGQWVEIPQGATPPWMPEKQAPSIDRVPGGPGGPPGGGPFTGDDGMGDFGGSFLREGWAWPSYQSPDYRDPGEFDPGPAFTYKDFAPPTGESMVQDPGFQFRLDQGRKALEASAAGRGVLRSGGTLKDILSYGQNFASQEFGNVFNRAAQEYDINRSNAADIWGKQYGQRRDVYGDRASNFGQQNIFNQRNTEFDFTGKQRQAELDFQDAYNRWLAEGNWNRDILIGGSE